VDKLAEKSLFLLKKKLINSYQLKSSFDIRAFTTIEREVTSFSESSHREVGRLLGEVNCD
jgi:hypothetical protein